MVWAHGLVAAVTRCADGVVRVFRGQWNGYLSEVAGDPDEGARRLAEAPEDLLGGLAQHWRSVQVRHWVDAVMHCESVQARRAMIATAPGDLQQDIKGQVAMLFASRTADRRPSGGGR